MGTDSETETAPIQFEEALEKTGNGLYNILLSATSALILMAIGVDLFGFSLVVGAACDLNLTIAQKGILTSLPFVGILLVSYFWGYVSDTRGRRFTLVICTQVSFVLSCLASFSPNWLVLGIVKFFSVCFSCATNSATYTLVGESCISRVKSKYMLMMTSFLLLSPAMAGVLSYPTLKLDFAYDMSWLGIVFSPWRLLHIVMSLPLGAGAVAIYFFKESPKFLANCGLKEEALDVLKTIYSVNNRCSKDEFKVHSLIVESSLKSKDMSLLRSLYEQSAPLFRPPLVRRTLQLYYIVAVAYITNNSFLVWLPHILNLVRKALESGSTELGNICSLINFDDKHTPDICLPTVSDNVIITLIASQSVYGLLNVILAHIPNRRKFLLMSILGFSCISGIALNLTPEPMSSVFFFVGFTCTCLTMGILASYFVDLFPTSYRGMVACLSIMVGRSSSFIGINIVGNLLAHHCTALFYTWAVLVFTSIIAVYFLPPDRPPKPPVGVISPPSKIAL